MICPNCGREIPDGTVCPCSIQGSVLSSNPAVNVMKSVGSSTIFLVMAILSTISLVLALVTNASDVGDAIEPYIYELVYNMTGINPAYYGSAVETAGASSVISVVSGSVSSGLTVVALWLHYAASRDRKSGNISTVGLTIWKVFTWIAIVGLILACVAVVIFMVALMAFGGMTAPRDVFAVAAGVMVFAGIFVLAVLALALACQIAKLRVINRAKTIAYNGIPDNRVSQFLIVMTWINGVFSVLVGLPSLFLLPLAGISNLAAAAVSILTALCLSRYKKDMTAVMYPPVMPVYAQPVSYAAPAAPQQPAASVTDQTADPTESETEQSE